MCVQLCVIVYARVTVRVCSSQPPKEHMHACTRTRTHSLEEAFTDQAAREGVGPCWTLGMPTQFYLPLWPTLHLHCVLETCRGPVSEARKTKRRGKGPARSTAGNRYRKCPVPGPGTQGRRI